MHLTKGQLQKICMNAAFSASSRSGRRVGGQAGLAGSKPVMNDAVHCRGTSAMPGQPHKLDRCNLVRAISVLQTAISGLSTAP